MAKYRVVAKKVFFVEAKDKTAARKLIKDEVDVCTVCGADENGVFGVKESGGFEIIEIRDILQQKA